MEASHVVTEQGARGVVVVRMREAEQPCFCRQDPECTGPGLPGRVPRLMVSPPKVLTQVGALLLASPLGNQVCLKPSAINAMTCT